MVALLLPSSIVTFFSPAFLMIARPTTGLPVKLILLTRGSAVSQLPTVEPPAVIRLIAPGGSPASVSSSTSRIAVIGVAVAGLSTMVQPAAIAGATLCDTRFNGKLNGEIE